MRSARWWWLQHRQTVKTEERQSSLQLACLLRLRMMIRTPNKIQSTALVDGSKIPWHTMYTSKCNESFIATTSLDYESFEKLLAVFSSKYIVKSGPGQRGRPSRCSHKHVVLASLLHSYAAPVEHKTLSELFEIPPSTLSRVLSKAEIALSAALRDIPEARIQFPNLETQQSWADSCCFREPNAPRVAFFLDGKNYDVQEPSSWLHSTFVTGVLLYGVDGTLVWGQHNFPASWNDSEMSRPLQELLQSPGVLAPEVCVAADAAFPVSKENFGRIVTPLKKGDLERASTDCQDAMIVVSNAITSLRQAAEWGMGSASKTYRALLLPLPYNPQIRARRLSVIYRLYNYRVRSTGISQIRSVFQQTQVVD
ncbi:hypothetical protein AC1031_004400 [Aphanomyces cochlioides]|nr:hypothetical protein AC1031_004400 [Aphanomyces cochlioides]